MGHPQRLPHGIGEAAATCATNAASVLRAGRIEQTYAKQYLPNYEVFDERRHFVPGTDSCVFEVDGLRLGLLICEDAWYPEPARRARRGRAQMLLTINASPTTWAGWRARHGMRERVQETGLPWCYAHTWWAGRTRWCSRGARFALNADGSVAARAPGFEEKCCLLQVQQAQAAITIEADVAPRKAGRPNWAALVLGDAATMLARTAFPACCWGCRAAWILAWCWRMPWTRWGRSRQAVMMPSSLQCRHRLDATRGHGAAPAVNATTRSSIAPRFDRFKTRCCSPC